jgi:1-deoxy-D-xylulose-5-phosphate synthase
MAPSDEDECRQMLYTGITLPGPSAVRYPRGVGTGIVPQQQMQALQVGRAVLRREGRSGLTLLAFGTMLAAALAAAEQLDATVLDMRFVKPLDEDAIRRHALQSRALVTLEENAIAGGAGSGVSEVLDAAGILLPRLAIGIPDRYIDHGTREDCLVAAGLDTASVLARISQWWLPLAAAATDAAASPHR